MKGCSDETIRRYIKNIRSAQERNKKSDETLEKMSVAAKQLWKNPEYVKKVKAGQSTPEYKKAMSDNAKKQTAMVKFDHFIFLSGLAGIPLFVLVFLWMLKSRKKAIETFGNFDIVQQLIVDFSNGRNIMKFVLLCLSFMFVVFNNL